jgi:hypothetical protein
MAACTEPEAELDLGETQQESGGLQGQGYQGQGYQGQGYQGQGYQGSTFAGATLGGVTLAGGASLYQDRALSVWRSVRGGYEQRLPDRVCLWNGTRTINLGCTTYAETELSPLAGLTFPTTFLVNGLPLQTRVRIKSAIGSVLSDSSLAMHPLKDHAALQLPGPVRAACKQIAYGVAGCENPKKCAQNCDLWTYDLELVNVDGSTTPFCAPDQRAYAVPGTYSTNGQYAASSTKFSFVCTDGTIAKCTSWGYRSFGGARMSDGTWADLPGYHQSCVRAATADYCSSGHSFTWNGTLVDFWDYDPRYFGAKGFVPRTKGQFAYMATGGLLLESSFDPTGAREIEYLRYQESTSVLGTLDSICPGRFYHDAADDVGLDWKRDAVAFPLTAPVISVDSTTACSHSELSRGKYLSRNCSTCAATISKIPELAHCTDATIVNGWDNDCVAAAQQMCLNADGSAVPTQSPLTLHGECTVGAKLDRFSTGCTMRVCSNPSYASCCSNAWTAACTQAAADVCPPYRAGPLTIPMCGIPYPTDQSSL